ncbi:trehalose-phosphatase [Melaminivora alkalimesophila]|uniref:Trehalose 6-phosphate phosphatase n=1 Tax=Melaminivora alkalimesophila TaxID=1165852 RepID=A0A317R9L7_9BURK|nr:trehalose-phosphatase [Melaminivora alkalimesophila]PWW45675.1 trehalose 6-phosphatase [Melaminivora alkalimesophila]
MSSAPTITTRHALFLDFDGTLADIAPEPQLVRLEPQALQALQALHRFLGGALAIVTGRALRDVAPHFEALPVAIACEHGAQLHAPSLPAAPAAPLPGLEALRARLRALAQAHPGLLVEDKAAGVALHYRHAPQLQALCREAMEQALADAPGMELLAGKCVFEAKPSGTGKGHAIRELMQHAPFAGRIPLFVGDDVTDEAGFAAVQALGGLGVKVGPGESAARARLDGPAAVRAWLQQAAREAAAPAPEARDGHPETIP